MSIRQKRRILPLSDRSRARLRRMRVMQGNAQRNAQRRTTR